MLEYDLGEKDDNKEALASVVDKMFGRHIFSTLRTEMQVSLSSFCIAFIFSPFAFAQLGYIAQGWFHSHFKVR